MACLQWAVLGVVPYQRALELQLRLRDAIRAGRGDIVLLLEHPTVITLGRSASAEYIRAGEAELARRGIEVVRATRGGEVTLHAPGQLVGYPLRRLTSRAVRAHVTGVIEGVRRYLDREHQLTSAWQDDNPGLWTRRGEAKIAAVGVDARGGVAMHGFALNLSVDLSLFELIVPCGLRRPVTSVEAELGRAPTPAQAAPLVARALAESFGAELEPLSPAAVEELVR